MSSDIGSLEFLRRISRRRRSAQCGVESISEYVEQSGSQASSLSSKCALSSSTLWPPPQHATIFGLITNLLCLPNRKEMQNSELAILTCYCCLLLLRHVGHSLRDNQTLSPGSG